MLNRLYIRNYALIEELDVQFTDGLTVITGETGAGKSIIMDALGLILGSRAETDALQDKSQKCIVEAEFGNNSPEVDEFLQLKGFDNDGICIIRREISTSGKSRTFLNDTPTTVQLIKELTRLLVDVHSQHQTLDIANDLNQFEVLDVFCDAGVLVDEYKKQFKLFQVKKHQLQELKNKQIEGQKELDYNTYLFEELEAMSIVPEEELTIEADVTKLSNADTIRQHLLQSFELLDHQKGINAMLKDLAGILSKVKLNDEDFASLRSRVDSVLLELKDVAGEIENLADGINNDPSRLQKLEERLDKINNLLAKHRVKSTSELLVIKNELSKKLVDVDSLSEQILLLEKEIDKLSNDLFDLAAVIFKKRTDSLPELEKKIGKVLADLGMPHGKLSIDLRKSTQLNINAASEIEFLFSANKGSEPKPIVKVASGGEFSRLMLALKSIVAHRKNLQVLIFDEIDAGVSGEIAGKMGDIMKKISTSLQVFAITHLPQVAVKGKSHFKVIKSVTGKRTVSKLVKLDSNNRVEEIAKMLSGEKLTPEAIANAKVLLQ